MTEKTCWAITDNKMGNQVQAQGLAAAVGFPTTPKIIALNQPWRSLPPNFWLPGIIGTTDTCDALFAPWPDLIISCGRQAVGPAAEIKRRAQDKTTAVHIQHPRVSIGKFDLVAAPAHDNLSGHNAISTIGSLGRINRAILSIAASEMTARFSSLPRPLIAVSIGGSNSVYTLDKTLVTTIAAQLQKIAVDTGGSLLITTSRRTGGENEALLRQALKDIPGEFWDGTGDNPYFAYLGSADYVVVTGDSVNMVSEACATGKPVHVIQMTARRRTKFTQFHKKLTDLGMTRPFEGKLEDWHYDPLDETARVAARVHAKMSEINN